MLELFREIREGKWRYYAGSVPRRAKTLSISSPERVRNCVCRKKSTNVCLSWWVKPLFDFPHKTKVFARWPNLAAHPVCIGRSDPTRVVYSVHYKMYHFCVRRSVVRPPATSYLESATGNISSLQCSCLESEDTSKYHHIRHSCFDGYVNIWVYDV